MSRYFITEPVPDGHAYYDVRDRDNENFPNFPLLTIYKDAPEALNICNDFLDILNFHAEKGSK